MCIYEKPRSNWITCVLNLYLNLSDTHSTASERAPNIFRKSKQAAKLESSVGSIRSYIEAKTKANRVLTVCTQQTSAKPYLLICVCSEHFRLSQCYTISRCLTWRVAAVRLIDRAKCD